MSWDYKNLSTEGYITSYFNRNKKDKEHNNIVRDYFYKIVNSATTIYEYKNLPEGLTSEYIERILFFRGDALFFKDENLGFIVMETGIEDYNIYDEPTKFRVAKLGYNWNRTVDNAVYIKSHPFRRIEMLNALRLAERLTELDKTIDQNVMNQRKPIILAVDPDHVSGAREAFDKFKDTTSPILSVKRRNKLESNDIDDMFSVLDLNVPLMVAELTAHKRELLNEFYTELGIMNAQVDKKERLLTDEVNSNNEQVEHIKLIKLTERKKAVDKINKMFGLNISVDFRQLGEEVKDVKQEDNKDDTEDDIGSTD